MDGSQSFLACIELVEVKVGDCGDEVCLDEKFARVCRLSAGWLIVIGFNVFDDFESFLCVGYLVVQGIIHC